MMTKDLNACHVVDEGKVYMTCKGRLSYAQNTIDGSKNDSDEIRYQVTLMCPPGSDFSVLKKAMAPIALEKLKGNKDQAKKFVESRFLDPMNPPGGGQPAEEIFEGWTMLRMTSKFRPDFVRPNGTVMSLDEAQNEVYSGRWARVTCSAYWFDVGKNKGVTLGLQNVQLLDHDTMLGGGKPSGGGQFGAVDGIDDDTDKAVEPAGEDDLDELFN